MFLFHLLEFSLDYSLDSVKKRSKKDQKAKGEKEKELKDKDMDKDKEKEKDKEREREIDEERSEDPDKGKDKKTILLRVPTSLYTFVSLSFPVPSSPPSCQSLSLIPFAYVLVSSFMFRLFLTSKETKEDGPSGEAREAGSQGTSVFSSLLFISYVL